MSHRKRSEEALFSAVQLIVEGVQKGTFSRVLVKNMLMPVLLEVYADHELLLALAIAIVADVHGGRLQAEAVQKSMLPLLLLLEESNLHSETYDQPVSQPAVVN